jgi:hypothetical protein
LKKVVIVIVLLITGYVLFFIAEGGTKNLVSPGLGINIKKTTTPTPSPTPRSFDFNEESNLEEELNSVNPEVREEDFFDLTNLIKSL